MSQQAALTPHIVCPDAAAAIDFYKKAFGAEELTRMIEPNGTRVMHGHLRIFESDFMLNDDFSDKMPVAKWRRLLHSAAVRVTFHLQVDDANAVWEHERLHSQTRWRGNFRYAAS